MKRTATASDVVEAFAQRGFRFLGKADDGWFRLRGELLPPESASGHECEIDFDPAFIELPRVRLLSMPSELPATVPHLASDGTLCSLAKGSVTLDIYDPVGQALACLERAAFVLGRILRGEMVEDLAEEFFAYWQGPPCFVDIEGRGLGLQRCIVAESRDVMLWFVSDNVERTTRKLSALDCKPTDKTVLTFRVRTNARPRPLARDWPPKTVGQLLAWQSILDPRCRRKIAQRVAEGEKRGANGVLILIESPLMTYAFAALYDSKRYGRRRSASVNPMFALPVMPLSVIRIDELYLAERNMPNAPTLAGKNLTLVGCGTIGGYLADMLVKAGAGTCGGQLTLVDFENLLPQNIGRHRLGFPHLLSNKGESLATELTRLAPGANIRALPVDVKLAHLGPLDLLIDATGEQSLGHWLCDHVPRPTPMMSVWIEGPGTAVRALLRSGAAGACYRCLWHSNKRGELRATVGALPQILAGHGCEGLYVPFPASVSVHAAALGTEMTLDWVNGAASPALRTRLTDRAQQLATPDCDPVPDPECPLCAS